MNPRLPLMLLAAGVLLRCLAPVFMDIQQDGATYSAMGDAFSRHGEFLMPWGDTIQRFQSEPAYSHHYSPLYPVLLSGAYAAAGFSVAATKTVALLVSLGSIAVVYACTRDLFGKQRALWAAALTSIEPGYVLATGTGFTENLVLLLFTVTLWGILRSLKDPRFILAAGAAASLGYLTRSGMGALFIIAGLGGLAWRLLYHGRKALQDGYYLAAAGLFGTTVAAWSLRNLARFGWPNWQTSLYTSFAQDFALSHPVRLLAGLFFKIPLFLGFLYLYWACFGPELKRARATWRQEDQSALWLSIALVVVIGWVMASVFWVVEASPIWWFDQHRYVVIAFLPLLWLVLQHAKMEGKGFQRRATVLAGLLVLASVLVVLEPNRTPLRDAAEHLELVEGMQLGLSGSLDKYKAYPYLPTRSIQVYDCEAGGDGWDSAWRAPVDVGGQACIGHHPTYILSTQTLLNPGNYTLERVSTQSLWFGVTSIHAYTYKVKP